MNYMILMYIFLIIAMLIFGFGAYIYSIEISKFNDNFEKYGCEQFIKRAVDVDNIINWTWLNQTSSLP